MERPSEPSSPIKTTRTSFSIIEALQELGEAGVTELADRLQLAPSTVHDHLASLRAEGYVRKTDGSYRLGLQFLSLGMAAKQRETVSDLVQPILEDVATEVDEVAWFMVEEGGEGVCVDCIAANGTRISRSVGTRFGLHTNATGKAILARLPADRRRAILDGSLPVGDRVAPIEDPEALARELETVRERGYATLDDDADGADAVAVAVQRSGEVHGAIGVSGPRYRFAGSSRDEIVRVLTEARDEIQVRIGREDWVDDYPQMFE